MFKRKRDWPMKVYQFRAYPIHIPTAAWDRADDMRHAWNHLRKIWLAAWRETSELDKEDEAGRKARWTQCNEEMRAALEESPLSDEEQRDLDTRFRATLKRLNFTKGEKPRYQEEVTHMYLFHRYTGGGVLLPSLFSGRAKRFALVPPSATYPGGRTPTERVEKRNCWTTGHFGLGNDKQITFHAFLHRPIPGEVFVKRVLWNGRKNTFGKWEWFINIMVEYPWSVAEEKPGGVVAIDFGWRIMGEGEAIRVAYCRDDEEREFELRLNILEEKAKQRRFRRGERIGLPSNYPAWIAYDEQIGNRVEACKALLVNILPAKERQGLEKMRQGGLARLRDRLKEEDLCLAAQNEITACLDDLEPIQRQRNALAERLTNKRRHLYRNFAAWLTKTYTEVVWEDELKIKELKSRESKKNNPALQHAGKFAQWAAPGELREILSHAAEKNITFLTGGPTAGSTIICSQCMEEMGATANRIIECGKCGTRWDQDANACRNLLKFSQTSALSTQNGGLRKNGQNESRKVLDIPEVLRGVVHRVQ